MSADDSTPGYPWYREGLRFECLRCGRCCTGAPGDVWVSEEEIRALAEHLGMTEAALRRVHLKASLWIQARLREKADHDCTFYDAAGGCLAYAVRPRQCRTWPFWRQTLRSPEAWADAARGWGGMNRGRLHALEEIERCRREDGLPGE